MDQHAFSTALALALALQASPALADGAQPELTINAVIGDVSWHALDGGEPGDADEVARIRTHLSWVEAALQAADVSHLSPDQRVRRFAALDLLARYRAAGVFPRRTSDAYAGRRPRFIDDRGVHCAVGHLIAATGHPALAAAIDADFEYAYVPEIDMPALADWAKAHGFSPRELAMIQPTYTPTPTRESVLTDLDNSYFIVGQTLRCARWHPVPASVRFSVHVDGRGNVRLAARDRNPFARCFTGEEGPAGEGYGEHEYFEDGRPQPFSADVEFPIPSPAGILQERVASLVQSHECGPRPGAIPERVFAHVRVGEAISAEVRTEPQNPEVEACLTEAITDELGTEGFGPGAWRLETRAEAERTPWMTEERLTGVLRTEAERLATDCFEHGGPERVEVRARAVLDADAIDIDVRGGQPGFERCLTDALREPLRSRLSVSRRIDGERFERFFRIDATVESAHAFEVETPDARRERQERERQEWERRERERRRYY